MFKNSFLNWTDSIYSFFLKIGNNLQSLFLLYIRITWGSQFFILGVNKLGSIENMTQFFNSLSIPAPIFTSYLIGILEIVCGLLMLAGFASRIVTIPLIVLMLAALNMAPTHNLSDFRFITEPLFFAKQTPYPFLIAAVIVFIFGPGKISVDGWLKRWAERHGRY